MNQIKIFILPVFLFIVFSADIILSRDIIWNIQLSVDLSAGTGAEFDGSYFYITNSSSNLIHKYDTMGNLVETFSIPGVTGLSDLAFDGTYMYGGTGSASIYQMDFVTHTVVNTITAPLNVRHIAYDENNDEFWIGNCPDPLIVISRSGILLNSFNLTLPFITGTAYDNVTAGGPYLWIFENGDQTPGPKLIHQFHIPSGTLTSVTHDVLSDVGAGQPDALAGGLFSTSELIPGTFSLGGILIGDPDILFAYEIENVVPVELTIFTAEYSAGKVILLWRTDTEINNAGFQINKKQVSEEDTWHVIGFVTGHGTTNQPWLYNFCDEKPLPGKCLYSLEQIDYDGTSSFSEVIEINIIDPDEYKLYQNYPNPFNPVTEIEFRILESGFVSLNVYDVLGNKVAALVDEEKPAGKYKVKFDGGDISNGIYLYELTIGNFSEVRKMILIK